MRPRRGRLYAVDREGVLVSWHPEGRTAKRMGRVRSVGLIPSGVRVYFERGDGAGRVLVVGADRWRDLPPDLPEPESPLDDSPPSYGAESRVGRAEFVRLLKKQAGRCAICGAESDVKHRRLKADHDHRTGRIRGLLCNGCNSLLGDLETKPRGRRLDPEWVAKARAYLKLSPLSTS